MPKASFAVRLQSHGERVALVSGQERLTFEDLAARADAVGQALGAGRRLVLLRARNDLDSLLAYLGALRAGHVVMLGEADGYDPDVVVDAGCVVERRTGSTHRLHPDLAVLLSTSGSTGSPKLVRLSHRNLDANAEAIASYLELGPDDRGITSLPMQYCYGLSVINSHLAAGAGVVLTDRSVVDRCFWDAVGAHGVTGLPGVPYTFDLLDRVGFEAMTVPSLRYVTQAGGRLAPERVRAYAELGRRRGWQFFVMYGQTEATARMAYLPPDLAVEHPDCIGVPIAGGSFEIDGEGDGDGDGDGELVYRGPNVMMGYAHGPADLALGATVDALRTGDLARRTPEGLYQVVGRRSRFVKLYGLRVDLDRVESLLRDAGVDAVCAGDDTRLVVAARHHDRVRTVIRERIGLPPSAVQCVDEAPRLANGKPDYGALRSARPASVAAVYAAVLGCDDVGDDDTFVGLGGDSLSYVEASVALERLLGTLPPGWPTVPVGELAATMGGRPGMEANVVLRAVAIVCVVALHAGFFTVEGGAHALLAVAGFNFARFQAVSGRMLRSVARIALPSMAVIGAVAAFHPGYSLPNALLLTAVIGNPDAWWAYWYVEALVAILLVLAAVLSIERVRRWEQAHRFGFAVAVLAVGLVVRYDVGGLFAIDHRIARPQHVLWLFALGWAVALATTTRRRLALTAVAAVAMVGYFGELDREVVVLLGVLVLIWVPTVRVARPLDRVVAAVAGASLYIYLTHWAILGWSTPAVTTVTCIALGVAVNQLDRAVKSASTIRRWPSLASKPSTPSARACATSPTWPTKASPASSTSLIG